MSDNVAGPSSHKASLVDGAHVLPQSGARLPLDRALRGLFAGASWGEVRRAVRTGKVSVDGMRVTDPATPVRPGASIQVESKAPKHRQRPALDPELLVFVDAWIVVVEKPAGLSSVPFLDSELDALVERVKGALRRRESRAIPPLGVVQRLDKETSGLIVFARTLAAKRNLKQQFRFHSVHRRYLAIAHGDVSDGTIRSRIVDDRGDGRRGSIDHPVLGRQAVTHVRALRRLDGATLIECRLETGRTHQIRIHLAERGHPLVGERVYGRKYLGPRIAAPRLMLHAHELGFVHPISGETLRFVSRLPDDFAATLASLELPRVPRRDDARRGRRPSRGRPSEQRSRRQRGSS